MSNQTRLENYVNKQKKTMLLRIQQYKSELGEPTQMQLILLKCLNILQEAIEQEKYLSAKKDLSYLVKLQKALHTINEIYENRLIGKFIVNDKKELLYEVNSYSVIDYVNAILGDEYEQAGGTLKAEWFGVPQERRRYIVIGIRKDVAQGRKVSIPQEPKEHKTITVGEAILDLCDYAIGYEKEYEEVAYKTGEEISEYATLMRANSKTVKNHITTNTTPTAMKRFKAIEQGKNFHSLSKDMKSTYSKPERTQNTIYLRLNSELPSGTVVNVRKSMWIHPTLDRAITVREAARLQSFPDDFEFVGTKDSQYQQVGNAVPPLMAEGIAKCLINQLK
jgi:DNA (cytosine-5)-methyltransferase 1